MNYSDNDFTAPDTPEVIPESIMVRDEGELPKGLYYYTITALTKVMESSPGSILQVYARYKSNSVSFEWKSAKGVSEYRIYRGTILGQFEGFFTVYSDENYCYFCDNGMGVLNEESLNPPRCP